MPTQNKGSARPDWSALICDAPRPLADVHDLTEAGLETRFGPAEAQEVFALGDRQDEFHISLQNKYPLADKQNARVQIKEMTWTGPACKITVWLDQQGDGWRTFDSLIYSKESEF